MYLMKPLLYIVFIFTLYACIEPYEPDIEGYENLLVVDGLITNQAGPYQIRLTRSFPYKGGTEKLETEATVKVKDINNKEYIFEEITGGTYQNIDESFIGEIGNSYKLSIVTVEGNIYESDYEDLKKPIPIDTIYYQFKSNEYNDITGLQIFIDTHDDENKTWYYGWTYSETWEIRTPYILYYTAAASRPRRQVCYSNAVSNELLIGSSSNNTKDILKMQPVYFINYDNNRLRYTYSGLIKQYTLNEKSYTYLKELKKINEEGGTLYDASPASLNGNIHNITHSEEPVLGIFQVSGITEKRIFIKNEEVPLNGIIPTGFEDCENVLVPIGDTITIDSLLNKEFMVIMDTLSEPTRLEFASSIVCFDCIYSGSFIKPYFWPE